MPLPGHHFSRRRRTPFDKQVLGVAVRRAEAAQEPIVLKLTEPRIKLLTAIDAGEVKAGQGGYIGDWRWSGLTVTGRVQQLFRAGWAEVSGRHVALTEAGVAVLKSLAKPEATP